MKYFAWCLLLILLLFCAYEFVQQLNITINYDSTNGNKSGHFGYPKTFGWTILTLSYWFFATIGLLLMMSKARLGWLIVMPLLSIALISLIFEIFRNPTNAKMSDCVKLVLVVTLLIINNIRFTFNSLRIVNKTPFYIMWLVLFIMYSSLYFIIDKFAM